MNKQQKARKIRIARMALTEPTLKKAGEKTGLSPERVGVIFRQVITMIYRPGVYKAYHFKLKPKNVWGYRKHKEFYLERINDVAKFWGVDDEI